MSTPTPRTFEIVEAVRADASTFDAIAERFGVTGECVRTIAKKHLGVTGKERAAGRIRSGAFDLVGVRVGRLTVLCYAGTQNKDTKWSCVCDCGQFKVMCGRRLRQASVESCGCVPSKPPTNKTHGEAHHSPNHSSEYAIWCGIKTRTSNPRRSDNDRYLHRGIGMHPEWRASYAAFLAAVGRRPSPKHSIGRINNDLGYAPGNVQWETREQQANNTRSNVFVEAHGLRLTLAQWTRRMGLGTSRALYWISREAAIEKIRAHRFDDAGLPFDDWTDSAIARLADDCELLALVEPTSRDIARSLISEMEIA